ncbi:MAG: hypothetical protein ABI852_09415 [Gemmatimonadaceae bacterium]
MTAAETEPKEISKRELRVLAAIGAATMLVMFSVAEVGARWRWPEQEINSCFERELGERFRAKANCSTRIKNAEGEWTVMQYNKCGYRSTHDCGPKPVGTRRIVLMGTSVAEGLFVAADQHFSARLEKSLSAKCGGPVEVQNLGALSVAAQKQWQLIPEAKALKPDAVVMAMAPFDLLSFAAPKRRLAGANTPQTKVATSDSVSNSADAFDSVARGAASTVPQTSSQASEPPTPTPTAASEKSKASLFARLRKQVRESRALIMAQHFLLQDDAYFFRAYKLGNDDDALSVPTSSTYKNHYAGLEAHLVVFGRQFNADSIPFFFVPLPNRIQAALLSDKVELPNTDPLAYIRAVKAAGVYAGIGVVDMFSSFAATPDASHLFYAVDGHPGGEASALVAEAIEQELLRSAPAFASCHAGN